MGDKVFRKMAAPLRSGPSLRRANLKRAMSKESDHQHGYPEPSTSNQDSGIVTDPIARGTKVPEKYKPTGTFFLNPSWLYSDLSNSVKYYLTGPNVKYSSSNTYFRHLVKYWLDLSRYRKDTEPLYHSFMYSLIYCIVVIFSRLFR